MNQGKKLFNNFIIFFIGNIGSKLLVFFMLPFYTSILSTSQYGQVDLVTTTTNLLLPIVTLGLADAVFRFTMSKDYDNVTILKVGFRIPTICFAVVTIMAFALNAIIKWQYMTHMCMLLIVTMYYSIESYYLKAIDKTKEYTVMGVLQTLIAVVLNVVFLKCFNLGIEGYVYAYVLSYFIPAVIIFFSFSIWKYLLNKKTVEKAVIYQMLKYSIPLIFTTLAWWIITSSDRYMIRFFMDNSAVGIYSVATKIPLILQMAISMFTTVWEISSNDIYENDRKNMKHFYVVGMDLYRAVGYSIGSIILIATPVLMKFLAKGEFYAGWKCVPFLVLSVVFSSAGGMSGALYSANKDNNGAMISVLIGALINVALNLLAIKTVGVIGVTLSTAVSRLFISIYRMEDTQKFLKFDRKYKVVIINSVLISLQAVLLICIEQTIVKYALQIILFIIIIMLNVEEITTIINMLFKYARDLLQKRKV